MEGSMKVKSKTAIAVLLGTAIMLAASGQSRAGAVIGDIAFCTKDASGAGTCYGTQRGFRNSPDATAQVDFLLTMSGSVAFLARYGGVTYTCSIPSNPTTIAFANFFSTTNEWFQISWDAAGNCTYNAVWKSSATGSNY
jgi:hypothetical protein